MRLDICELLVPRAIGIDPAQLVEVASRAGENDSPDVWLGRQRGRRSRGECGGQIGVLNIDRRNIDLVGWDEDAQSDRQDDQKQTNR